MVQDLIIASRRVASLYRFKYLRPAHLLHAMTTFETGQEILSREGFDISLLRAAMLREFKGHSATVRAVPKHIEPSELFDRCSESYLSNDDTADYEGGLMAILATIRAHRDDDRIVNVALEEADMTRGIDAPRPDETECLPGLDDLLDQGIEQTVPGVQPVRSFQAPHQPGGDGSADAGAPGGDAPAGDDDRHPEDSESGLRSAFRDRHARTRSGASRASSSGGTPTKEAEEARNAVRAAQRDLTEQARSGGLDPVIGRDAEIDHVIEVLLRRRKPNVILVAEPGIGKTALAEGVALKIASQACPDVDLAARAMKEVSLASMVAGTRYRGDFESRMKILIEEADSAHDILFIDEIHMLMGSGAVGGGGMDGANILKPALSRDGMSIIGATTPDEMLVLRKDRALMRRFEVVYLDEPNRDRMETILANASGSFLEKHGVAISAATIGRLLDFGERYVAHRRDPDRSFDLLDLAAVKARLRGEDEIFEEDLRHAVARLGGSMPVFRKHRDGGHLSGLGDVLSSRVAGQGAAMSGLAAAIEKAGAGANAPSTIRMSGPEGTGKTHAAGVVAGHFGKRLVTLGFEDTHPDAFTVLWNRLAMALEADGSAIVLVQGAGPAIADRIDRRLAGEVPTGSLPVPPLSSPLVFCTVDRDAHGGGFGFRAASGGSDAKTGDIRFLAYSGESFSDLVGKVADDVMEIQRDAGVNLILRDGIIDHLHAKCGSGDGATYMSLKKDALDMIGNL